ncbi:hypothetical protein [Piscirickettsia salmonis]|uniref:hypothetical protein n=1 Tax=Piscirickettsia salmonis TaxID=1238 RepID=UPI0007C87FAF|nr:hypothetical protein A0O36_00283 [Piscirickettsiaceae bacterium NZ-RLO1]
MADEKNSIPKECSDRQNDITRLAEEKQVSFLQKKPKTIQEAVFLIRLRADIVQAEKEAVERLANAEKNLLTQETQQPLPLEIDEQSCPPPKQQEIAVSQSHYGENTVKPITVSQNPKSAAQEASLFQQQAESTRDEAHQIQDKATKKCCTIM